LWLYSRGEQGKAYFFYMEWVMLMFIFQKLGSNLVDSSEIFSNTKIAKSLFCECIGDRVRVCVGP